MENAVTSTGPRRLVHRVSGPARPRFSVCTMVTRWDEYRANADTFRRGGFDVSCAEYLVIDNSAANAADGYVAMNEFLQTAQGDYIIVCHQDVELLEQGRDELETCLAALTDRDPDWGVCGNAGYTPDGRFVLCISHPFKARDITGVFPAQVMSLDENFIVVRREANLALSRDLTGFHHYGTDLCLVAALLGWNSYVIDYFLRHNSAGSVDRSFMESRLSMMRKYQRAIRPRWVWVPAGHPFYLSGSALQTSWVQLKGRIRAQLSRRGLLKRLRTAGRNA